MDQVNTNRPMNQGQPMNQPAGNPNMNNGQMPNQMGMMPRRSKTPWIILVVVIVVILAVLGYLFRDKLSGNTGTEKLSGYQAIFLTNGQVYFGKLSDASSSYVTLKDIYYLQVNQQLQPSGDQSSAAAQAAAAAAAANPQLSLVKLGNELHGPADLMKINRDQILFYEDLKADGKVAQAIASYQKNGSDTTGTGTGTTGTTGTGTGTGTTGTTGGTQSPATGGTGTTGTQQAPAGK